MGKDVERCIGRVADIIYVDRHGKMSQRRVKVHSIKGAYVCVFCLEKRSIRTFRLENILSIIPVVKRRAG
jgi:predicted DNA-binding transcriptional regulator YafY